MNLVKTRLGSRIPYPLAAAVSFGAVIAARALFGTPLVALVVGVALAVALGALVW